MQPLREKIELQKHLTLVPWVVECAQEVLEVFESRHPEDPRPRAALEAAHHWARGNMKMQEARRAAIQSHRAAAMVKDDPASEAAARAMEHAVGTVYVQTHAMGFVLYSLSAVHLAADMSGEQAAQEKCRRMYARLWYWEQNIDGLDIQWAPFLTKEDLNLEKLLRRLEKFGMRRRAD